MPDKTIDPVNLHIPQSSAKIAAYQERTIRHPNSPNPRHHTVTIEADRLADSLRRFR
jgi:hypothetical protein